MRSRFTSGKRFIQRSQTGTEFGLLTAVFLQQCGLKGLHLFAIDPTRRAFPDGPGAAIGEFFLDPSGNGPACLIEGSLHAAVSALWKCFSEKVLSVKHVTHSLALVGRFLV